MDTLKEIVHQVVSEYAKDGFNFYSYLTQNADGTLLTVVDIEHSGQRHETDISVVVHINGNVVIIERDQNDKLVVDALIQAGIPRENIILAYAGEAVPDIIA